MSKIVKAINVMVSNPSLITDAIKGEHDTEIFFKYAGKYNWSILKNNEGTFYLNYYTSDVDLNRLACIPNHEWEDYAPPSINYNSKELATREAIDSLTELYTLVNEKVYGMNDVLDEIIASDYSPRR